MPAAGPRHFRLPTCDSRVRLSRTPATPPALAAIPSAQTTTAESKLPAKHPPRAPNPCYPISPAQTRPLPLAPNPPPPAAAGRLGWIENSTTVFVEPAWFPTRLPWRSLLSSGVLPADPALPSRSIPRTALPPPPKISRRPSASSVPAPHVAVLATENSPPACPHQTASHGRPPPACLRANPAPVHLFLFPPSCGTRSNVQSNSAGCAARRIPIAPALTRHTR